VKFLFKRNWKLFEVSNNDPMIGIIIYWASRLMLATGLSILLRWGYREYKLHRHSSRIRKNRESFYRGN
jgi:hypothetical protein